MTDGPVARGARLAFTLKRVARWRTPPRAALASLALLGCALAVAVRAASPGPPPMLTGTPAPAFALQLERNGQTSPGRVTLAAQRGHPVLLLFTYSLCAHCLTETAEISQLDAAYRSRGLQVLYLDSPAEAAGIVAAYAQRVGIGSPVLLDPAGKTAAAYGIQRYPAVVLVDANGVVRGEWTGETSASALRSAVESSLVSGG